MNRRNFLRATLATAALPVLELVPLPVAARASPLIVPKTPEITIWDRALSDEEMAALSRGHGLLTVTDQWGIPQHTWIIPSERIYLIRWGTVVGEGVSAAVANPHVVINGSVEFTKTDPGITVIEGLMCSCPAKFEGHIFRKLRSPIHMMLADTLHIESMNFSCEELA